MRALESRITTYSRDGLRFDVTDEGPLGGDVVVLLHGFPTDRTSWDRVAARLHEAGLRTLAPDQRGYSPAACPPDRDAYRLDELVADVVGLIEASGRERVHLVGHDWGGALAWLVAGNHPTRIASLTVLSTPHPAAMSRAWRSGTEQKRKSWYMAAFQVPRLPERALAARFDRLMARSGLPAADRSRYAVRLGHAEALTGPINWYRAARHSGVAAHRVDGADDLRLGLARPVPRPDRSRADPRARDGRLRARRARRGALAARDPGCGVCRGDPAPRRPRRLNGIRPLTRE